VFILLTAAKAQIWVRWIPCDPRRKHRIKKYRL